MKQMKHLVCAFFILAAALFSCGRPGYPPGLVAADSLSEVNPDSAMAVLGSVERGLKAMDDDALWYYRLLRLKVRGKAYEAFSRADSTEVFAVLDHYRRRGDRHLLPQAYYYAGCVVRDIGNAPMAIDLFQQGMDAMADTTDLKLRSILNFQTGFLLFEQGVYAPAVNYFKESLRLERLRKDTAMMAYCYEKLAYTYEDGGVCDSALHYHRLAILCAKDSRDSVLYKRMVASMASYYVKSGMYGQADSCLAKYSPYIKEFDRIPFYGMKAIVCMNTGRYDEGYSYCKMMLDDGTVLSKQTACRLLIQYYLRQGAIEKVSKYVTLFSEYSDSLDRLTAKEVVSRMNASYNYNIYKIENAELKAGKLKTFAALWTLGLAVMGVVLLYVRHLKVSRRNSRERELRWISLQKEMQEISEANIRQKEEQIYKLALELEETKDRNAGQSKLLMQQKEKLEMLVSMAHQKRTICDTIKERLVTSSVYSMVHAAAKDGRVLSKSDWMEIDTFINELIPNFRNGLYCISEISEQDYRLCLLIRIGGLAGKDMAILLGRTDGAVSKAKRKLQERFLGDDHDKTTFEKFVTSL